MCQPSVAHIADVIADVLSLVCTDPDFDVSSLHNVTSTPLDKLHTCTSHAAVRQLTRSGIFSTTLSCYTIANSQTTFLGRLHLVLLVRCKGGLVTTQTHWPPGHVKLHMLLHMLHVAFY